MSKEIKDYMTVGTIKKVSNDESIVSFFDDSPNLAGRSTFVKAVEDEINFKVNKGWLSPIEAQEKLDIYAKIGLTHFLKVAPVLKKNPAA